MKMTIKELEAMNPCEDALEYARKNVKDFRKGWDKCELGDWMIWFLRRKGLLDKPTAVKLACICAKHVLGIFEKKYPEDKRPRKAIESALKWLKEPTEENRKAADAADAAYAAAYAAYAADAADAAYAAAYAAYAADAAAAYAADAAYAAAYAAYAAAAAYAAYAADAAYAAGRAKERKWQADQIRKLVPNPFDKNNK